MDNTMMPRAQKREAEFQEAVPLEFEVATNPGPNNKVWNAWAEVNGVRVTKVPVGQAFDIFVDFEIENLNMQRWHAAVTAIWGTMAVYADSAVGIIGFPWTDNTHWRDTWKLAKVPDFSQWGLGPEWTGTIMQAAAGPAVFRIKVWMHDVQLVLPNYPPIGGW